MVSQICDKEDRWSPKIEIEFNHDSIANFIAQASTENNKFVRIVDISDVHILDAYLVDMYIFKEFKFNTGLDLGARNIISLKALDYLEGKEEPYSIDIKNMDYLSETCGLKSAKEVKLQLNELLGTNFII